MKIIVNNNQRRINFKTHVGTIIMIAKQKAEAGITSFYYPIPRNQGINTYNLINAVEEETEETVYGGYKCIRDGQIKFSIKTV
jgi:hypothetical protein